MKKALLLLLLCAAGKPASATGGQQAYRQFFPRHECDSTAFSLAWRGFQLLQERGMLGNKRYLSIIDFSKKSSLPRFFVLDVLRRQVAVSSVTAHGIGSDPDSTALPQRYGNRNNSRMSSLGFYITGGTYYNHRPADSLGMCLFGLERGYNDSAAFREIVVHYGASESSGHVYVTDKGAARSFGCPALPLSTNTHIINLIKNGSCLFVYAPQERGYAGKSDVLNGRLPRTIIQHGPPPNNCRCHLQAVQRKNNE